MFEVGGVKILFYKKPIDMRKSIDGLSIVISESLQKEPHNGFLYVFYNRCRDKLKILYWQRNGFCLWYKRLEKERFKVPQAGEEVLFLSSQQLRWLLDGLDIYRLKGHREVYYNTYF